MYHAIARHRVLNWRHVAIALYIGVNLSLTLILVRPKMGPDWSHWEALRVAVAAGDPYAIDHQLDYIYSPVLAPVLALLPIIGYWPFAALKVAAVSLLRDPLLILLTLTSWAFWSDVGVGNVFSFVFIAGVVALRGSRWGIIASIALFLLMPRPVHAPLVAWLAWRHRHLWPWFLGLLAAHTITVLATGFGDEWLATMGAYGIGPEYDIGPTAWFGTVWLLVGIPLGVFLTVKGQVGLAGLAMTTYLLPQYMLVPLWDLSRHRLQQASGRWALPAAAFSHRPGGVQAPRR